MARTVKEIKQSLCTDFISRSVVQNAYGLSEDAVFDTEFSKVSFESILFDVFAFAIYFFEKILDTHKSEIDTAIYEQKSGTPNWYKNMSLAFQYGFDLLTDSDTFDNTGFTDDQIDASKIIKYCSVKESLESARLTIKVAGESGDVLEPLTGAQNESFLAYLNEIKYAGVKISIINNPADLLVLTMVIYRDALVIDELGNSIVNGGRPVETAVRAYMKDLPFNGELVLNDLIEKLRAVSGVDNAHIVIANASAYDSVSGAYLDYTPINVKTIPVAGYFEILNFDNVTYVV